MRDPSIETDPRLVSAFSVYKGLSSIKSYEDTSASASPSTQAKRNKKKARKRNRQSLQNGDTLKDEEPKPADKQNQSNRVNQNQSNATTVEQNGESSGKKKKQKKRKKKNKERSPSSEAVNDTTCDSSMNVSDDEIEPPRKSRKTTELVPNPLATSNLNGKGAGPKSSKKDAGNLQAVETPAKTPKKSKKEAKKDQSPSNNTSITAAYLNAMRQQNGKATPSEKSKKAEKSKGSKPACETITSKVPPPDRKTIFSSARVEDSVSHAKEALEWLLHPVSSEEFMKTYWEKKPLLIKRKHDGAEEYYKWMLTTQMFDDTLRRFPIKYGINLDITSYTDGKRETLSEKMQGRVRPAVVWDYYNNGCSIRMLNPQTYVQPIWRISESLQEWFGSFVGANMYLTPPDSQGFAPHYDDIEAFILQIEGKKRWKLYAARNPDEVLPRFSSKNFSEETDNLGRPIIDVVLDAGDLLYFPRGMIHQAQTVDGEHSLHVTLSCNQLNTYGDLLKHHVNNVLESMIAKDVNFRKGLPTDYMSFMGIAHQNTSDPALIKKRDEFAKTVEGLVSKLAKEPADFAADAMGKKFIWDALPPYLNSKERETTVVEDGEFMKDGKVFNRVEFGPETKVKLVRKNCVRLVVEEEQIKLYFSSENPLTYHEEEPQYLELSVEQAPTINYLISQYPKYTKIEDLPISSDDIAEKVQVVSDLWERGLLFTKEPLEPCDYDDFGSDESDDENLPDQTIETTHLNREEDDDDVESIDLSELPEEGNEDDSDEDSLSEDDFYETSLGFDDSDDSNSDEDENSGFYVTEEGDSEVDSDDEDDEIGYTVDEDGEVIFDEDDDDEDDEDDDEGEEEEDEFDGFNIDEDDFDKLDEMEDSEDE